MKLFCIILLILIILSALAIIYIIAYNKLQFYKTRIEKAESTIDEDLRKKYDILCELNIDVKKTIEKNDYLKEYIELKNIKISNYEMDRKMIEAFNLTKKLQGDYKKLNTKNFNSKLEIIKNIDEELMASKTFYNKNTTELNLIIRKFPSSVIAKIHHFKVKPYFDNKNMQDAVIDDFKL